jgi:putative transcriptional regulator
MVNEQNFGALLIESLEEAVAIQEGRLEPARVNRYPVTTTRKVSVSPPPHFDAERIRNVRERTGLSQDVFAKALNVGASTVRAWEQGERTPAGSSLRLLEYAERKPDLLRWNISDKNGAKRGGRSAAGAALRKADSKASNRAKHQRRSRMGVE